MAIAHGLILFILFFPFLYMLEWLIQDGDDE